MKVKTSRKLLGYWACRLGNVWALDFCSLCLLKINGEEKNPHLNCQEASYSLLHAVSIRKTSSSALVWSDFTRFQGREDSWIWVFQRRILGVKIASLPDTFSLRFSFSGTPTPPTPPPAPGWSQTPHILLPTRTRTNQLRAKTQREKFEIFQSNKSHKQLFGTQYSSALDNRAYCCHWFKRGQW